MKPLWAAALVLLAAGAAWGRAGGGGGYSGSSGSSFSSGSSYSSRSSYSSGGSASWGSRSRGRTWGSDSSYDADDYDSGYGYRRRYRRRDYGERPYGPIFGMTPAQELMLFIPFVIVAVGALLLSRNNARRRADDLLISDSFRRQAELTLAANVDGLRRRVPGFEMQGFLAHARQAFLAVQDAWSAGDMSSARSFVTEGVLERFSAQLELQRRMGVRNEMSQVQVLDASMAQVELGPNYEALHVRLRASAVDVEVALDDGRRLRGSGRPEEFEEIWSFLRGPGGSWRVSEITQTCEWSPRTPREDAAVCAQELEDRASVVFWRWQLACAERSPDVLRPAATRSFIQDFRPVDCREPAVGGARLLSAEGDVCHVEVKWSCHGHAGPAVLRHVVTLRREGGVWLGDSITPAGQWRAPAAARPAASHDWAQPLSPDDAVAVIASALCADGRVERLEREYIEEYARSRGIPRDRVTQLLAAAMDGRLDAPRPACGEQAELMLKGLIHSSLADGRLSDGEQALLNAFAARLSLPPRQLDAMIEEERQALAGRARTLAVAA